MNHEKNDTTTTTTNNTTIASEITNTNKTTTMTTTPTPTTPTATIVSSSSSAITIVFSSMDLVHEIVLYLINEPTICLWNAHTISKTFYNVLMMNHHNNNNNNENENENENDTNDNNNNNNNVNCIWKQVCYHDWSTNYQWGFHTRWKKTLNKLKQQQRQQQQQQQQTLQSCNNDNNDENNNNNNNNKRSRTTTRTNEALFWKREYKWHEIDRQRHWITPEELTSLVFDFRFWILEYFIPNNNNNNNNSGVILQSGLHFSVSSNFQFQPFLDHDYDYDYDYEYSTFNNHNNNNDDSNNNNNNIYTDNITFDNRHYNNHNHHNHVPYYGTIVGHPSGRDDLEWFLTYNTTNQCNEIQWGKMPHLWPKATIVRLTNNNTTTTTSGGWEIRNPNVCLRAIDPDILEKVRQQQSLQQQQQSLQQHQEYRMHHRLVHHPIVESYIYETLWTDRINSIQEYTIQYLPEGHDDSDENDNENSHGQTVQIQVPPVFWEFLQNRLRFPRRF